MFSPSQTRLSLSQANWHNVQEEIRAKHADFRCWHSRQRGREEKKERKKGRRGVGGTWKKKHHRRRYCIMYHVAFRNETISETLESNKKLSVTTPAIASRAVDEEKPRKKQPNKNNYHHCQNPPETAKQEHQFCRHSHDLKETAKHFIFIPSLSESNRNSHKTHTHVSSLAD